MQIKMSFMQGMPNIFKGSPTKPNKPAGKLKEAGDNIERMSLEVRKVSQQSAAQIKQYNKTPKVKTLDAGGPAKGAAKMEPKKA